MKPDLKLLLLATALLPTSLCAQQVDRSKYPDYSAKTNPDPSLMKARRVSGRATDALPEYVNNAQTPYFPPVLEQQGGSCGSASRICYMFSHELNSFRGTNGKDPSNYYPSHFVWLLTNGNSGKDAFVQFVGVPSAKTYGGQAYSKYFGYQEETQNDFGWMTGYDKWYEGMFNRMYRPVHFTENVGTQAGREAVKRWLYNHNGDTDFHSGGIVGIGCASAGIQLEQIGNTPANAESGVVGQQYVKAWGTTVDHAMTIVGYDDRIEFDLNGNGKYGEASADERGAWIMVNSWGDTWANQGFVYCPYAYAGASFKDEHTFAGNWWAPEVYKVRKNYRPLRTIKVNMDYTRRSEMALSVGVAKDLNATAPEFSIPLHHFQYAGDGKNGNTVPAPEIPMLGRWNDGKLHDEPMEFGYDLTDLTDQLDANDALKYFFVINTRSTAQGEGHVYNASILDYSYDKEGLEIPFETGNTGVKVQNQGQQTVLSVVVPGRGVKAPQNVAISNNVLSWTAPVANNNTLTGYKVMHNNEVLATLASNVNRYELPAEADGSYGVVAVYANDKESKQVAVDVPAQKPNYNKDIKLDHNGLTLPGVFNTRYDQATIEYWISPLSLANWNQSAGPGWGSFMFHANANGTFTAGWALNDRLELPNVLNVNQWTHVAIVVDANVLTVYVNGSKKGTLTSQNFKGLGGFGDLVFSSNGANNDQHAYYDEIRIWNKARTSGEIMKDYRQQYATGLLPQGLQAYYRSDMIEVDGQKCLRDLTGNGHHGVFANSNVAQHNSTKTLRFATTTTVSIEQPSTPVVVGQPITLRANGSTNIASVKWSVTGAELTDVACATPTLTFNKAGEQTVKVVVTDVDGKTAENEIKLNVGEAVPVNATFKMSKNKVAAGERVTFMPEQTVEGYRYQWSLQGTQAVDKHQPCVTVAYDDGGAYDVALTVTDIQGQSATTHQTINVVAVVPKVDFDVEPAVVMKGEKVKLTNLSRYNPTHGLWTLSSEQTIMQGEGLDVCFQPDVPGIYDVKLTATNSMGSSSNTLTHGLVVCNADSKTGLAFIPEGSAYVELTKNPLQKGQTYFSIDWWMRPNTLRSACNGIGDSKSTFELMTTSSGQMRLFMNDDFAKSDDSYVIANEWHHYAVTFYLGAVCYFRDGELICRSSMKKSSQLPEMNGFKLGTADAPMCAIIDEFRVWNTAFNENKPEVLQGYITAPLTKQAIATAQQGAELQVYYQFNQNSGDVQDATSNQNTGVRKGFGPDGDAWTNSRGVFALNFNGNSEDVTEQYLRNYVAPFANTGAIFNNVYAFYGNRFMTLKDWTLENVSSIAMAETKAYTGACVDTQANVGSYFTICTGYDGFGTSLKNHKAYQTFELPAGAYVFTAVYPTDRELRAADNYLVVAEGSTLPNTENLSEALSYKQMAEKDEALKNSVFFMLTEPTTVSVGVLSNMQDKQQFYIKSFNLKRYDITPMNGLIDGIGSITLPGDVDTPASINAARSIYDLSGRRVAVPGKGVYIIGGKKVVH